MSKSSNTKLQQDLARFFIAERPDTKRDSDIANVHTSDDAAQNLLERLNRYSLLSSAGRAMIARTLMVRIQENEV